MAPKTNKLIVYLIKPQYTKPEEIVESSQDSIEVDLVGRFYFEDSGVSTPAWVKDFFGSTLLKDVKLFSASARGVLLVPVEHKGNTVNFAVSFGLGRHLLRPGVIEDRFGLKVVLNSVNPESLRSIDKTTLGSVPKHSKEQIGKDSIAGDFGIDIEQDLVSSVTGKSRHQQQLGKTISGKDSLSVSTKVDVGNIKDLLRFCYEQYLSTEYKKDFEWIDQISDVRDQLKIDTLNALLLAKLSDKEFAKIWMAVPEVVDWVDIKGFRYLRRKEADLVDDLDIKDFLEALKDKPLNLDLLKQSHVFVVSSKTDEVDDAWTAFQCMYAEIEHNGLVYILNNGKWYEIVKDFAQQINTSFAQMEESEVGLVQYSHSNENEYNKAAAEALPGSCCMDRELIYHGGGHSSIEFCDIYEPDAKRLIHVKQYGGSSHLSHLFSQGAVAGELFVADQAFRQKLNQKLPAGHRLADHKERPNATAYEIVYGIISDSQKPLDIPFFSKVSLKNAKRRLEGYGYHKVTIKKIQQIEPATEPTIEVGIGGNRKRFRRAS
jgi:uncharacterized protein (TIGR04141 family)